jgi:hypothetical protein
MVDGNLLFGYSTSSMTYKRRLDPMLLKALLMNQRCDIEGGASTPPSTDSTPQVARHDASTEDIPSPVVLRSEGEQLVGQELIKALSDYKQLMVTPVSPHTQQFTSLVKKSIVVHPVARTLHHHQRAKIKSWKPLVKIVGDMLIKKWVLIKRDKHLGALAEVARFLEAVRLPPLLGLVEWRFAIWV